MPPTPPRNDEIDFDGLDMKPSGGKASKSPESDFEKELEALFAEELAAGDEKPASAPPVGAPEFEPGIGEDALLLDDLVDDAPAKTAAAPAGDEDILDLGGFAADDAVLDLSLPDETPGGKDGGIDAGGLDDLISGLGEPQKPAAPAAHDAQLDSTDMAEFLEDLDVPAAAKKAAAAPQLEDEPLDLSLGDLLEEAPAGPAAELAPEPVAVPDIEPELPDLGLTLPDLSDPEPGRDLVAEQEQADLGGELNLSLGDLVEEAPAAAPEAAMELGDLDLTGLAEAAPAEEAPAPSLDPNELLEQIPEPVQAEPVQAEPVLAEPVRAEPAPEISLDAEAFGMGAAAVAAAAVAASTPASPSAVVADAAVREQLAMANRVLAELQERFADLTTQVTGGGVAIMRLEGRLAEKDQALADLEDKLKGSQDEAERLRAEITDLRGQLEDTLRQRLGEAEKASTSVKERLALVEDRQAQLDREVQTEIARAVPREAAKVIREEIAALAASLRDE